MFQGNQRQDQSHNNHQQHQMSHQNGPSSQHQSQMMAEFHMQQVALQQQADYMEYMQEFRGYDQYGQPIMGQIYFNYGNRPPY